MSEDREPPADSGSSDQGSSRPGRLSLKAIERGMLFTAMATAIVGTFSPAVYPLTVMLIILMFASRSFHQRRERGE